MQSRARAVETAATHTRSRPAAARLQPAEAGASGRIIIRPYCCCDLSCLAACQATLHTPWRKTKKSLTFIWSC